uniref:ABC transporter B family member 19-like n=1 Tax=Tanacetum cinerariifolium TaxID=118510 RepID=A0A6L2MW72_TANCI|nr:ABC transporter B family member 19-like [Tanacetum cinerariifolium]
MLLLDEATSTLDSESEKLVQDAVETAMKGRTVILIAHRMSTIVSAYMIEVVQNGQVTETGTHSNLLQTSEFYSNLFSMQNISTEGEPSSISHVKETETTDQRGESYDKSSTSFVFSFSRRFSSIHGERPSAGYDKLRKESLESEFGDALTSRSKCLSMYYSFGRFLALYRAAFISYEVFNLTVGQFFIHDLNERAAKDLSRVVRIEFLLVICTIMEFNETAVVFFPSHISASSYICKCLGRLDMGWLFGSESVTNEVEMAGVSEVSLDNLENIKKICQMIFWRCRDISDEGSPRNQEFGSPSFTPDYLCLPSKSHLWPIYEDLDADDVVPVDAGSPLPEEKQHATLATTNADSNSMNYDDNFVASADVSTFQETELRNSDHIETQQLERLPLTRKVAVEFFVETSLDCHGYFNFRLRSRLGAVDGLDGTERGYQGRCLGKGKQGGDQGAYKVFGYLIGNVMEVLEVLKWW